MNLLYTADGHRTDFDESELAELPRLQDVHLTMIAKQDVFLMLKRVLVHGPKRTSDPGVIERSSIIRIVVMMVINRSKAREEHRPADVRLRALFAAKDVGGAQRMSLNWKFLIQSQFRPGEVASFGERSHLFGRSRKPAHAGQKLTVEKFSK